MPAQSVPNAGMLVAIPALVENGLFHEVARICRRRAAITACRNWSC